MASRVGSRQHAPPPTSHPQTPTLLQIVTSSFAARAHDARNSFTLRHQPTTKGLYMNKANTRKLNKALAWLATGDATATDIACRTLATIQRAGTASDTKTILAVIKENGLSHKFYTDNHCLVAY